MFARAAYPTDKVFFMTYRFDLKEAVDPDALKQAWEKTLTVYPYMSYAVVPRNDKLLLTENPLPFVIRETGEIVEPFERSGNFHMVTFCYLGRTLYIYIDWYQGFHDAAYIRAMRDEMAAMGMKDLRIERVE